MNPHSVNKPIFYGVGVGPGDPELITLKASRIIQQADVVSFITNPQGHSVAKNIASNLLVDHSELFDHTENADHTKNSNYTENVQHTENHVKKEAKASQIQLPIMISMAINRSQINAAYDKAAAAINTFLTQGKSVAFLCEGDPLFFGSFTYLMDRMPSKQHCKIIPGITSINAASAQLATPLTMLSEDMAVISSRSDDQKIIDTLLAYDTVAILKAGPQLPRLAALLASAKRANDSQYIEYATHNNERIVTDLSLIANEKGPYFSLLLITRQERAFRND